MALVSATVNVKQDDQVDLGNRLLHELTMHIPAMSSIDPPHTLTSGRLAIGRSGRHASERLDGMLRNQWSAWARFMHR